MHIILVCMLFLLSCFAENKPVVGVGKVSLNTAIKIIGCMRNYFYLFTWHTHFGPLFVEITKLLKSYHLIISWCCLPFCISTTVASFSLLIEVIDARLALGKTTSYMPISKIINQSHQAHFLKCYYTCSVSSDRDKTGV